MATDVTGDFAPAGRVTDHRDVPEIERLDHGREIVGVSVHVVPGRRLAGPAMTATIVSDDSEAALREKQHLAIPGI